MQGTSTTTTLVTPRIHLPSRPTPELRRAREHLSWQLRCARVLTDLLTRAAATGLPVIAWTVGHAGAILVGHCYGRTAPERRTQFEAWCAAAGASPEQEFTTPGGTIHLRAVASRVDGLVDVVLLADLYAEDEPGDPQ